MDKSERGLAVKNVQNLILLKAVELVATAVYLLNIDPSTTKREKVWQKSPCESWKAFHRKHQHVKRQLQKQKHKEERKTQP